MHLMWDKYFPLTMTTLEKNVSWSFTALAQNFLTDFKAPNYHGLSKQLLNSSKHLRCNMSVKVYFLHSYANYFPENLGAMIEEQGLRFHQDIKPMEKRFPGCWNTNMMADYCWCLKREVAGCSYF